MSKGHFQDKGAEYAKYRPTYPPILAKTLADLSPHTRLALDIGCGSGQFSVLLADHFNQVIASDVSQDQLASATTNTRIIYKQGPAEKIDADDNAASLIVAAQAAHWFDLPSFYNEVRRVACDGALLALITYSVLNVEGPAKERIHHFYWDEIHKYWPKGREHVENGYRNFDLPFEPVSLPDFTIERTWSVSHFCQYVETWSATKRARAAGDGHLVDRLRKDLSQMIGAEETMNISWPITIRAGRIFKDQVTPRH